MRDEELILRFFAFQKQGLNSYRTPQKHWLNQFAKAGMKYPKSEINRLSKTWEKAINNSLVLFKPDEAFRRPGSTSINRALFDLITFFAARSSYDQLSGNKTEFKKKFKSLMANLEFQDLISRAVDHTKRTKRRFELWEQTFRGVM
jgi:hypothetical protein